MAALPAIGQTQVDLVIEGGAVVTMDPANRLIPAGAVAVSDGRIVAVDRAETIRQHYTAARVLDAHDKAIMPGLVDTYGHGGHGLIKGILHPRLGWPTNVLYFHATTERWWYTEGLLAALERLRFGVTCGFTVVGATPARMDSPVFAEAQARAAEEVGIRSVVGIGPPDIHVSHLPTPWTGVLWEADQPIRRQFTYEDTVRNCVAVIEKWHAAAEGRVRIALHVPYLLGRLAAHPRFLFTYNDEHVPAMIAAAEETRALADRYGLIIHSHIFRDSVSFALAKFGAERLRWLLGPDVVFAHANGLSEEEVRVLGEAAVSIAVVPFTHENIMYGVCPAVELLRAGANVTISTDGTAPYASYDLFREISRALWAQWVRFNDLNVLPAGKGLRMVTIDAARALGLDQEIGSLEVGKRADIILVNLAQPHLTPQAMLPRLLAFYTSGHDVDTVLVNGKILMEDRTVKTVDMATVLALAREEAAAAFGRFDIAPYLTLDESFWQVSAG
ncbi:MAG: amidohydrolase family protein [Chloroflexi bacterium]|nr:amidohydrolase family protein [Chloroflexota bacterium]